MDSIFDTIRRWGFRRGPERLVGGVCGGLARTFNIDVWAVRVLTVLVFLVPGIGLGTYLVVWLVTAWQDGSIPLETFLTGRTRRDR